MSIHRTRDEWRAIIEKQRLSGLSQTRFCRLHGITTSAFSNARQRLSAVGVSPSAFVPALPPVSDAGTTPGIDTLPADGPGPAAITAQQASTTFSLLLPGATLCLPVDISPHWLATLLREMAS